MKKKNEKELQNLMKIIRIYGQNIGMKFRIEQIIYAHNEKKD